VYQVRNGRSKTAATGAASRTRARGEDTIRKESLHVGASCADEEVPAQRQQRPVGAHSPDFRFRSCARARRAKPSSVPFVGQDGPSVR